MMDYIGRILDGVRDGTLPQEQYVVSEDGMRIGRITNKSGNKCRLPNCPGHAVHISWDDNRQSRPCSERLQPIGDGLFLLIPHPRHETIDKER